MSAATTKPADLSEHQFAQINSVLDDLDILEEIEEVTSDVSVAGAAAEVIEEQSDEIEDLVLISEAIEDVKRADMRKEAYENQESSTPSPDLTAVQTADDGTKTVKKAGKTASVSKQPKPPKQPGAPRAARDISSVPDELFKLRLDDAADRDLVMGLMPKQKKIAEKFENLFIGLHTGGRISTFTIDAYKLLKSKGVMTSSDLVAAYKADGYDDGTARAQCGQIMNLFNALEIAKRDGSKLEFNNNSAIAAALDDWIAKKATP